MRHGIHFISGLPRAGTTLLRQNPLIHAAMTIPVGALFSALIGEMSQRNEPGGTVFSRVDGLVEFAWNAVKEAYYGEETERLLLLTYETLTRDPGKAMAAVYDFIGAPVFAHDFNHVDYAEEEFDARLGTPGLHRVAAKVQAVERQTILPPELFRRFESDSFWRDAQLNLLGVRVV